MISAVRVSVMARGAVIMVSAALLAIGAFSATAALGGPNVADQILSTMGIDDNASPVGQDNANPNAFEGADNAGQGIGNASATGQENANPNAFEGADNAGQGIENASPTGLENADPNASEGADNAGQGIENAPPTGQENANPNAAEGAANAGQGIENVPEHSGVPPAP